MCHVSQIHRANVTRHSCRGWDTRSVPEAPKSVRLCALILFALCVAGLAPASQANQGTGSGQTAAPAKSAQAGKIESTRPSDPNLYTGSETCIGCHEEIGKIHEKSAHAKTELSKNAAFKGCEGCHGP